MPIARRDSFLHDQNLQERVSLATRDNAVSTRLTSDTPATAPADELATEWPCYFGQLQLTSRELVDERERLRLVRHDASDAKGN